MDTNYTYQGILPETAPLATPYVPFQVDNPPVYDAPQALVKGTLFPGLELPFMGYVNENNLPATPLEELQVLAFAIQELALYLDTHRNDSEALKLYRSYQNIYRDGKVKYEAIYGPLTHDSVQDGNNYQWLSEPWPWEYSVGQEA